MKRQKFPHRSFAPAPTQPDILIGHPFAPAMTISSIRKYSRERYIYAYIPSNAKANLTVKERYICPGVLGGALCNGPAYGPNTKKLYTPVVDWSLRPIKASEDRYI